MKTTWSILFDPDPQPIVDENDDKPGEEDPTDADPDKEKRQQPSAGDEGCRRKKRKKMLITKKMLTTQQIQMN